MHHNTSGLDIRFNEVEIKLILKALCDTANTNDNEESQACRKLQRRITGTLGSEKKELKQYLKDDYTGSIDKDYRLCDVKGKKEMEAWNLKHCGVQQGLFDEFETAVGFTPECVL